MQNDTVIQQVLDRIEKRVGQFDTTDKPTLKVIAAPVSPDQPMIQPIDIYDLYKSRREVKKVDGGVCIFTEPTSDDPDKSLHFYTELNEYGIVYYRSPLYEKSGIPYFINNIHQLLKHAKTLYSARDYPVNIRIHASVNNVFKEELAEDLGTGRSIQHLHLHSKLVCYDSQVCVSTAEAYLSTVFGNVEHQKTILEELTMPLLWAFNVSIDSKLIVDEVRHWIRQNV